MAKNTKLKPGEHSIDRNEPVWIEDRKAYRYRFSVCLHDGRLVKDRYGQGATKKAARANAEALAARLLLTGGNRGDWKPTSPLAEYIRNVSLPKISQIEADNTRARYRIAAGQLLGTALADQGHSKQCDRTGLHAHPCARHAGKHRHSFEGLSIADGTRFRAIEANLQEIARLHGAESARQAQNVLSRYVIEQLVRDELLPYNPLARMTIDLTTGAKAKTTKRGGAEALTRPQWQAAVRHLLEIDPAQAAKPRRGRWTLQDAIAKRRAAIDLALLQAATGARQFEANGLTWDRFDLRDDGEVIVELHGKGGRVRWVPVFDPRVTERLLARKTRGGAFVIGSPTDPNTPWERANANKAARSLYNEIGTALEIPLLTTDAGRSHMWRRTLNTMLRAQGVPEDVRAAYFGHEAEVNRRHYTDLRDASVLIEAAKKLREEGS